MKAIYAIANQKGGTAKTTTAHAIGTGLILKGYKVLFLDLDAQGNLSYIMGASSRGATIATLLQQAIEGEPASTQAAIQHTEQGDIIPSSQNLAGADTVLADVTGREYKIREILEPVKKMYDYIIIDTPPTLGTLTVNALTAATGIIAPVQADVFSLIAVGQLHGTITTVKKYCNPALSFTGILLTRYNNRAVLSRDIAEKLEDAAGKYNSRLFTTRIRECTALKESEIMQQSIYSYAPKSNAAADYSGLVDELLKGDK